MQVVFLSMGHCGKLQRSVSFNDKWDVAYLSKKVQQINEGERDTVSLVGPIQTTHPITIKLREILSERGEIHRLKCLDRRVARARQERELSPKL